MTHQSRPQRKSLRLQGYDYSQNGAYFVTICAHNRRHLFGSVVNEDIVLNRAGEIASKRWDALPKHHPQIEIDAFVVMPNHVHGIIVIVNPVQHTAGDAGIAPTKRDGATPGSLGAIVGAYKSSTTRLIRQALQQSGLSIWQRGYHDHIIRNEAELKYIREYVLYNPALWHKDTYYEASD